VGLRCLQLLGGEPDTGEAQPACAPPPPAATAAPLLIAPSSPVSDTSRLSSRLRRVGLRSSAGLVSGV